MGFLQLIPADKLKAEYNAVSRQLILTANGQAIQFTSGIMFNRDRNFVGGLKFSLMGWVGPLTGKTEPYQKVQAVDISLPSPVINSQSIIVVTANHPQGVKVEIEYATAENNGQGAALAAMNNAPISENELAVPDAEHITVVYGQTFKITHAAGVPTYGSINIAFDQSALELVTAGIDNNNIVWTFRAHQIGNTNVVLTISGGIAQFVARLVYDVTVIAVDATATATAPAAATAGKANGDKAILNFLGRANIGLRMIRAQYPNAELYEVDTFSRIPTTNPNDLAQMKVVCQVGNGTAIINSTGWGTFGPVQYIDSPWLEDQVIDWPINMDITEACQLMRNAGYTQDFRNATLRKPLYPGVKEPSYIFGMVNGTYIFVGTISKKVTVNGVGAGVATLEKA